MNLASNIIPPRVSQKGAGSSVSRYSAPLLPLCSPASTQFMRANPKPDFLAVTKLFTVSMALAVVLGWGVPAFGAEDGDGAAGEVLGFAVGGEDLENVVEGVFVAEGLGDSEGCDL